MDYIALLKRAFQITIKYRALWIFGFFLALCSASGGGGNGGGSSGGSQTFDNNGNGFDIPLESIPLPENLWLVIGGIVAAILCFILFLVVVGIIVRAVTRTALIGMVDQIEETETVTIRDGWRIGWSKRAWTVFLVSAIVHVPLIIIFAPLLLVALSPFALAFLENMGLLILGIVAGIGLLLLWILALIIVIIVAWPLLELGWRYAVLRKMGAIESLKASYTLIRENLKTVAIMVLLLIGVVIGWALVSFILTIIVVLLGLLVGGVTGLIVFLITWKWWAALLVGVLPFLLVIILCLTFAQGVYLIFRSSVWTLTFRELTLTGQVSSEPMLAETSAKERDVDDEAEASNHGEENLGEND
jgi:hypothetical protein